MQTLRVQDAQSLLTGRRGSLGLVPRRHCEHLPAPVVMSGGTPITAECSDHASNRLHCTLHETVRLMLVDSASMTTSCKPPATNCCFGATIAGCWSELKMSLRSPFRRAFSATHFTTQSRSASVHPHSSSRKIRSGFAVWSHSTKNA